MDTRTLVATITQIGAATVPEELFGPLSGSKAQQSEAVKRTYHKLARLIHPDIVPAAYQAAAQEAFGSLNGLREEAAAAIEGGTYGNPAARVTIPAVVIRSRKQVYTVDSLWGSNDLVNLYHCRYDGDRPAILKVVRSEEDNDLITAEANLLHHLWTPDQPQASGFFPYLPRLIDTFGFKQNGTGPQYRANVFEAPAGFYTLAEVMQAYPAGISPRHMAWIWRQLLFAMGYAHARGVVNGAVLPPNVLIHPEGHDLMLFDWTCAVRDPHTAGGHIPAMSWAYESWYPPEVAAKQPPSAGTDILMSARCMVALMGGNPVTGDLPAVVAGERVSLKLRGFLKSCLLLPPYQRPQDSWGLRDEFTRLIEEMWGPRKRILFSMPRS